MQYVRRIVEVCEATQKLLYQDVSLYNIPQHLKPFCILFVRAGDLLYASHSQSAEGAS